MCFFTACGQPPSGDTTGYNRDEHPVKHVEYSCQ